MASLLPPCTIHICQIITPSLDFFTKEGGRSHHPRDDTPIKTGGVPFVKAFLRITDH